MEAAAAEDLGANVAPLFGPLIALLDQDGTDQADLTARNLHGRIAHKGERAPIQAGERWYVERTHAWQNAFHRIARCYERPKRRT
ncbi:hypothetical protein FHR34_008113 [Kitasatospora kifunensis]|uniref:Uncharacterized protein n=1 Tax=Kitasatospora kifunensis TaxID=58351 RepID=A0A7W7RBN0_KITKI|nr:hypothetical protein [Kitasatospora kifunensis]